MAKTRGLLLSVAAVVAVLAGALSVAPQASAGSLENFYPCHKSNDCKSLTCWENKCQPSGSWNGHGAIGTECDNNGNCASHACEKRRCVAPKAADTPRPHGTRAPRTEKDPDDTPDALPEATPAIVLDDCGKDLLKTIYDNDADLADIAARDCKMFSNETIARGKPLALARIGVGFSDTLRAIDGRSDAEVACGKKAWEKLTGDDRDTTPFVIPVSCRRKQTAEELDGCVKDLLANFGAKLRPESKEADARYACSTYDTKTLDTAKKVAKAGYGSNFLENCRVVDGRSEETLACARKDFAAQWGNDRASYTFSVPTECEDYTPRKK